MKNVTMDFSGRGDGRTAPASESGRYGVTIAIGQQDGFATSDYRKREDIRGTSLVAEGLVQAGDLCVAHQADGDAGAGETELLAHAAQK
jgi:hypothetical protein